MIRLANKTDVESINKLGLLVNDNFINTYRIYDYLDNSNYIILVNEDELVNGSLIVYKNIDYYELEIIVVDPNYRNKGIAKRMLSKLLNDYVKNDEILLEVAVNNKPAINLYSKMGLEVINTRKKYYNGCDAYVMKRVVKWKM